MEDYNKHYVITDDRSCITDGLSDGPHPERSTDNASLLTDLGSYQFRLFADGEENPPLYTHDGIPLYCWIDGTVCIRKDEDIEVDRANLPKPEPDQTQEELLQKIADLEESLNISMGGSNV